MHFLNWLYLFLQIPQLLADGILAPAFGRMDSGGILPLSFRRFEVAVRPCRAHVRPNEYAWVPLRA